MNLKTVKKETELALDGIAIEAERQDGNIVALILRDKGGNSIHLRHSTWSQGLNIFVPCPPPMVTRYRIEGEIKKVKFSELFESEYGATVRRGELDLTAEECPVVKVEVPE